MGAKSDGVRYTRAGDQFHYRWAARRCLALLEHSTDLVYITIEGISVEETSDDNSQTGEEVIDVAEYYGSATVNATKKPGLLAIWWSLAPS